VPPSAISVWGLRSRSEKGSQTECRSAYGRQSAMSIGFAARIAVATFIASDRSFRPKTVPHPLGGGNESRKCHGDLAFHYYSRPSRRGTKWYPVVRNLNNLLSPSTNSSGPRAGPPTTLETPGNEVTLEFCMLIGMRVNSPREAVDCRSNTIRRPRADNIRSVFIFLGTESANSARPLGPERDVVTATAALLKSLPGRNGLTEAGTQVGVGAFQNLIVASACSPDRSGETVHVFRQVERTRYH
jgi:hypothetical protein